MNLRYAVAAVAGAAIAFGPATAAWADYPPSAPTVQLLASSTQCSDTVGATGTNWKPNSTISLTLQNVTVGSVSTNSTGAFSTSFVVPAQLSASEVKAQADGVVRMLVAAGLLSDGTAGSASTSVTINNTNCGGQSSGSTTTTTAKSSASTSLPGQVGAAPLTPVGLEQTTPQVGAGTQTSGSSLPLTGAAAIIPLVIAGSGLVALGGASVMAARRRRTT